MKRKLVFITISIFLFLGLSNFHQVTASEQQVGFSVQAVLPENQYNPDVSYYDLRVEPDQEQELLVNIYNHEAEEIKVRVSIHDASTNSNGLIVYEPLEERDPSLEQSISDLVTLPENEVTIPANETVTLHAKLVSPEEPFAGIKLGGFHFEKVPEETDTTEGVQIENRYAYVIGLQLSQNDEVVEPELHLQSVEPTLVNYRTAVVANIQNSEPLLVRNLTFHAEVFRAEEEEVFKEASLTNGRMAPNSNMDFVIDWENKPLEEGDYRLVLTATDGNHEWRWDEAFTIEGEAEAYNEEAVELETESSGINSWFWLFILIIAVLLVVNVALLRERRKYKNS